MGACYRNLASDATGVKTRCPPPPHPTSQEKEIPGDTPGTPGMGLRPPHLRSLSAQVHDMNG